MPCNSHKYTAHPHPNPYSTSLIEIGTNHCQPQLLHTTIVYTMPWDSISVTISMWEGPCNAQLTTRMQRLSMTTTTTGAEQFLLWGMALALVWGRLIPKKRRNRWSRRARDDEWDGGIKVRCQQQMTMSVALPFWELKEDIKAPWLQQKWWQYNNYSTCRCPPRWTSTSAFPMT